MRFEWTLLLLAASPAWAGADSFVNLKSFDFRVVVDLYWAGSDTPAGKPVYPVNKCLLRRPVAEALSRAQASLTIGGHRLRVLDCYRPLPIDRELRAQFKGGAGSEAFPRGNAVDVTLIDTRGSAIDMPTPYRDSKPEANARDAKKKRAKRNATRLREALEKEGFQSGIDWWHFEYPKGDFVPEEFPLSEIK